MYALCICIYMYAYIYVLYTYRYTYIFCIWFVFWATHRDTQGFLIALHSRITLWGSAQGTFWEAGESTWVGHMQNKCPAYCIIFPVPSTIRTGLFHLLSS